MRDLSPEDPPITMVTVCAWCERYLGVKDAAPVAVSHGICEPCIARQNWDEPPVVVVSRERSDLLHVFGHLFRGVPAVQVVLDRRRSDRRRFASPFLEAAERRTGPDRRQRASDALLA